jgi:WD40 repeat protein
METATIMVASSITTLLLLTTIAVRCGELQDSSADAKASKPEVKPARVDQYGDPLPEGAVARFGSIRFRHAALADYVFVDGGKTVLTAGGDRVLRFWDVASGRQMRQIQWQETTSPELAAAREVDMERIRLGLRKRALSPDGKLFAERTLTLRSRETGEIVKRRTGKDVGAIAMYQLFSPDGKTLLSATEEGTLQLWNHETNALRRLELPAPRNNRDPVDARFSKDGKWLVVGGEWFPRPYIVELPAQRMSYQLAADASNFAVSPDSKHLVVTSTQGAGQPGTAVCTFDLPTGKEVNRFHVGRSSDRFINLAFSPDGKSLVCGSRDNTYVVDHATGQVLRKIPDHAEHLRFTPDGKWIAGVACCDPEIEGGSHLRFWEIATGNECDPRPGDLRSFKAFSPDGRILASAEPSHRRVCLWDTSTGKLVRRLAAHGESFPCCSLIFSRNGQILTALQSNGDIESWSLADGSSGSSKRLERDPDSDGFSNMWISPDGETAYTLEFVVRLMPEVRIAHWEAATGRLLKRWEFGESPGWPGFFSADGKGLAIMLKNGISIVDLKTGLSPCQLRNSSPVMHVDGYEPSRDFRLIVGRRILAPGFRIWETLTGKDVTSVTPPQVNDLTMLPDNRTVLTTDGGTVYAWDVSTGKEQGHWQLPWSTAADPREPSVTLLSCPDRNRTVTLFPDGTCLIWDLARLLKTKERSPPSLDSKQLASLWQDLEGELAAKPYAAIWKMSDNPAATVPFLRDHLRPVQPADSGRLRQLVRDLDSDQFKVREDATKQLIDAGQGAAWAFKEALNKKPSLESRRRLEDLQRRTYGPIQVPSTLRNLRAIAILEEIGTKEARDLLRREADGTPYVTETTEAAAALERLKWRP